MQGEHLTDPDTLTPALKGVEAAYYLVHSLAAGRDFHDRDVRAARAFATAAAAAGVGRIIYLGGLGGSSKRLREHLRREEDTGVAPGEDAAAGHGASRGDDHRLGGRCRSR